MKNNKKRFLFYLERLNSVILKSIEIYNTNPINNPIEIIYKDNARTFLFQLEGLARIENKIGINKKICTSLLLEFKAIEDALGKYDYWYDLLEKNKNWNISIEIEEYLKKQLFIQAGLTEQLLIKYKWINKNNENKYEYNITGFLNKKKKINKIKIFNEKKELKLLLNLFISEIDSIHNKLIKNKFNLNDLENGIHEFRRKLRWVGIYSSALNGKVVIDSNTKTPVLKKYITNENKKNKFNILPVNKEIDYKLNFLPGGYYAMSELIAKIGVIKDKGLISEEIIKIGNWINVPKGKIKKRLSTEYKSLTEVRSEAKYLIDTYIIKENILIHIANHFKNQLTK
jgi:hypothetical protein